MRVYIQQIQFAKFLSNALQWEDGEDNALEFHSSVEAIEHVFLNRLERVQIVIQVEFDNSDELAQGQRKEI